MVSEAPRPGPAPKDASSAKAFTMSCYITVDFAMAASQFTNLSLNNSTNVSYNDLVFQMFHDKI